MPYNGQIGCGWYEETEEDLKHQELRDVAVSLLKKKLTEIFSNKCIGVRAGQKMLRNIWR